MFKDFIKFYFIILCTIYISFKILHHALPLGHKRVLLSLMATLLSIICCFLDLYMPALINFVCIITIWFSTVLITNIPKATFISSMIAFLISYSFYAFPCFITTLIIYPFFNSKVNFPHLLLTIISVILQSLLSVRLFRFKRFINGMPFLFNTKILNISTYVCFILLFSFVYIRYHLYNFYIHVCAFICFFIIFTFLIHWWQAQITKSYKQALINRELESLRMELEEKEKQLAELSARNEELGRLIHKDNKRIPAMEHAVSEFLVMDLDDKEKVIERANALLIEIQKLSDDRNHMVTEINARKYKHHDYGISELDNMLNYMEKRAYGEHIKLSVQTAINFHDFVPKNISAEDLSHMLSDLLENAIIAAKHSSSPVIQLQFYQAGKDFVIEIADNGIPFETASLVNFGLEQLTTHADTGGSGIGLMDIWKIKEKCGVSLHITEYNSNAPYSKKIALIFNKKNRYTISTERKEELLALSKRTDLQIF